MLQPPKCGWKEIWAIFIKAPAITLTESQLAMTADTMGWILIAATMIILRLAVTFVIVSFMCHWFRKRLRPSRSFEWFNDYGSSGYISFSLCYWDSHVRQKRKTKTKRRKCHQRFPNAPLENDCWCSGFAHTHTTMTMIFLCIFISFTLYLTHPFCLCIALRVLCIVAHKNNAHWMCLYQRGEDLKFLISILGTITSWRWHSSRHCFVGSRSDCILHTHKTWNTMRTELSHTHS